MGRPISWSYTSCVGSACATTFEYTKGGMKDCTQIVKDSITANSLLSLQVWP